MIGKSRVFWVSNLHLGTPEYWKKRYSLGKSIANATEWMEEGCAIPHVGSFQFQRFGQENVAGQEEKPIFICHIIRDTYWQRICL